MKYFNVILLLGCAALLKETRGAPSNNNADVGTSSGSFRFDFSFKSEKDVKFYLHDQRDLNNPQKLKFNSTINSELVNIEWKTLVFIHGWKKGHRLAEVMKNVYSEISDHEVNLIEIDWSKGANNPLYSASVKRVPEVGETVAKFIGLNQKKFNSEKFLMIGHDLGAHAAGFAGKFLQSNYNFKPQLIVGLDPAGPLFRGNTGKLQPADAQEVLVIHTSQKLGHLEPLGTYDVYINGGKSQPRCSDIQSHGFSILIYRELVRGKEPLIGHPYSSFAEVTNDVIPETAGVPLLYRAPQPSEGVLMYVSTKEQPYLIAEAKEYIDSTLDSKIAKYCAIM